MLVEVAGGGFRGTGSAYVPDAFKTFAAEALVFPLPDGAHPEIFFDDHQGAVGFEVTPKDAVGHVFVRVRVAADSLGRGASNYRNEATVTLETTYAPLERFLNGVLQLLENPESRDAVTLIGD